MRLLIAALLALAGCSGDPPAPPDGDPCADQAPGTACTWLGVKGREGFSDDGGLRYETQLNQIQDLLFLPDGRAWYSDFNNHLVREIADDRVTTIVGWNDPIFPGDGPPGGPTAEGAQGSDWQLFHPTALLPVTSDGIVSAVMWHNHKLLDIDAGGWVRIACGGGDSGGEAGFDGDGGPASAALLRQPSDATRDDAGNLYLVDQLNLRVRRVDAAGTITTLAGTGDPGDDGDGGPASDATFSFEGGANPNPSGGILHHAGKLYVADSGAHRLRVIDLQSGQIDAFAGTGTPGYAGDGAPARDAQLQGPRDLEIGPDGHLYLADTDNGAVRAIDLDSGIIRTVAGTGELGMDAEEQLPATETHLRRPFGIAFDPSGNLYVMDSLNNRVVRVAR